MASLTITYPDALASVLTEALARYGQGEVDNVLINWLKDRDRAMDDQDIAQIRAGTASPQVKARVRTKLGM